MVAYTQAAAQGIKGSTIHGLLNISCSMTIAKLNDKNLAALEQRMKEVRLIVLDEFSIKTPIFVLKFVFDSKWVLV